jgi:protein-S-isoprenylcysteine O-methyltransferase Ste14
MDWFWAWAYLTVIMGVFAVNAVLFLPRNLELIAERAGAKENTKSWDRTLVKFYAIFYFVPFLIAGLDYRFGWSPQLPLAAQLVALVIVVAGYGLVSWAMISNKFFSRTVRIQTDRGHTVATAGPYQYVRHPGYVGMLAYLIATPLMLGSLWALIPAVLVAGALVVRTSLEDKTLQEELHGYRDYAQRVKYRLVPKIW